MAWWMPFARRGVAATAPPSRDAADDPNKSLQPWQKAAWGYFKTLGEIHYGCGFYSRMLAGVKLVAEERDAVTGDWVESENEIAHQSIERLQNSRGGLSALQSQYGQLRFVQGEAMLACTLYGEPGGSLLAGTLEEEWEMLSVAELRYMKEDGKYQRQRVIGGKIETIPETDPDDPQPGTMIAYRIYHRDAEYSGMADSSMRAVLADCEELLLLKQAIRNTARNRGAGNGILILPASLGGNELDMGDGKMIPKNAKTIYDALMSPIANENESHAVAPIILFAPNHITQQEAFHIDLRGAALYKETGLRDECIRRIAIGLDMPPEALLGTASANHWTAWQIDDSAWTNHGDPVAREFCEELTSIIMAPMMLAAGANPDDFRIWYDPTDVVEDPDRGRAAAEAFDRLAISEEAYRRETGWTEDDAPDQEEWDRRAAIASPPAKTRETQKSEPGTGQATAERVIGMAEACVMRCRELAGSKLRTKMQANGTPANLRARIKGAANHEVPYALADEMSTAVDADALVAGAGQAFLAGMFKMGLERSLAETLVRRVEEHAARTLFDEDPGELPEEVLAICGLVSMRV